MPVDPASLVALSDLSARSSSEPEPFEGSLPAVHVPAWSEAPVDVPQPFWVDPVGPEVGIDLVAASPEPTPADEVAPHAAALQSWTRSVDLAARRLVVRATSLDLAALTGTAHLPPVRLPDLGTFPTLDAAARRRLALLAGSSVAAGLACGLVVPASAEAAPASSGPATAPTPESTEALLASPSPFADIDLRTAPAPAGGDAGAAAVPAVPAAPQPGTEALLAALLAPATSPFGPSAGAGAAAPSTASAPPAPISSTPAVVVPEPVAAAAPRSAAPAPAPTRAVAPAAPAATPSAAAALPGRTTAAVVVVTDPVPPRPGHRPAPVVVSKPAWKPTRPLPAHSGTGRRIVYAERTAHLWIVGADGTVLRDYKVTGRADRPKPGTYHVFSKSRTTSNPEEKLRFDLMVRFTHGVTGAPIGFHTIPKRYDGTPIQSEKDLGRAIGMGGCVRQARVDAEWLYAWSRVGDTVVVLH